MSAKKWMTPSFWKLVGVNALRFLFSIGFITGYRMLFGAENTLAGVAVSVGLTMLPVCDVGVRRRPMAFLMLLLYVGAGAVSQLALVSPFIALPVNFLFVFLIMALTSEPVSMKVYINFLLTFVFCEAMPVPMADFPARIGGLAAGGLLIAAASLLWWRKKGVGGAEARTLTEQMRAGLSRLGPVLRMSIGIALAMFIASMLHLKRPLWLSIVVMSLTQFEVGEMVSRIKYRTLATIVGAVVFGFLFGLIIPLQYAMLVILLLGYLSYFTAEYKHKQFVNAISAIDAALVLLDPVMAIANRILCLAGGIAIVVALYLIERLICRRRSPGLRTVEQKA